MPEFHYKLRKTIAYEWTLTIRADLAEEAQQVANWHTRLAPLPRGADQQIIETTCTFRPPNPSI